MGCAQSRIENEESVSRCKDRKMFMKEAVAARNAFAAAHSAYAMALKNSGAALSDYGNGEVDNPHNAVGTASEPSVIDTLPPPPPPLPIFSPSPLQRAASMPEFPVSKRQFKHADTITEHDDEIGEQDGGNSGNDGAGDGGSSMDLRRRRRKSGGARVVEEEQESPLPPPSPPHTPPLNAVPPPPPESKGMEWDYFFFAENMQGSSLNEVDEVGDEDRGEVFEEKDNVDGADMGANISETEPKTPEKGIELMIEETPVKPAKEMVHPDTTPPDAIRGSRSGHSVNLLQILRKIDDHFLHASQSAHEVCNMLEANRLHYHSNFADNRGHIDHAARVMRAITWNKSFRGMQNGDGAKDDFGTVEHETHATVLDKLLAWEKKLYDEVKAAELMKLEYQRKVALLSKQKKRGASSESLEKTKAAVSHLHTRYIVDMQSMDSTVSEVNHLRDDQLYPKLVALVDRMVKMWETMSAHHDGQLNLANDLKALNISHTPNETSKHHYDQTQQLLLVAQEWSLQFDKLVTHQKKYIQALNSWLKLNLVPIESSLKEKISSPPRILHPPIQPLLVSWHDHLNKLPDELAKTAISSFAAVIKTIIVHQEEEMKMKEKCEETRREFLKKSQAFEDWYSKYMQSKSAHDDMVAEGGDGAAAPDELVTEKRFVVESLKKRLEEEVEAHQRQCVQVREKSLGNLKTRLPELFRALSDYSHDCSRAYDKLMVIIRSHNSNGGSS